jgi:hypothetical protein
LLGVRAVIENGTNPHKGRLRGARNVAEPLHGLRDPGGTVGAARDGVRRMEAAGRLTKRNGWNGGRVQWDAKLGDFVRV